jgi:uncharacterized membrane protein YeaQ/YmgE (transglycosylase-associated protein family)
MFDQGTVRYAGARWRRGEVRAISIGSIVVWIVVTALIGIVGAFIGGWVLNLLGFAGSAGSISLGSILTATLGAIILLAIYRLLTRRTV